MNTRATMTLALAALLCAAIASPALAITYTTFDYTGPGALAGDDLGIRGGFNGISGNNIVGSYIDSSGPITSHGFLYNGSSYTTLVDPPESFGAYADGISGNNIVGSYIDSSGSITSHGFLYNGSTYTTIDPPGSFYTDAYGISGNNIVGISFDSSNVAHGFLYNGSKYTTLDDPLAGPDGQTVPLGISGSNIVGANYDSTGAVAHGFLYNGTTWTTLDDPLAGERGTIAEGISGGNIVGQYYDSSDVSHGFLYNGSTYTTLDGPLGTWSSSYAAGIDGNTIIGGYYDASGEHGFLASVPEPSTVALAGVGFFGLFVCILRRQRPHQCIHNRSGFITFIAAALLQFAAIADAQTYTIQQIGPTDPLYTYDGSVANNLYGVNATGQVFGNANRFSGDTYLGDDTWFYSPTTHTTQVIGLTETADVGTGGAVGNHPSDMNAAGQVAGVAYRFNGSIYTGRDAWLYSPTTNSIQVIGLMDPVHTQPDGSSQNFLNNQNVINGSGQVVGSAYIQGYDGLYAGIDVWIYSPATNTTQLIGLTDAEHTGPVWGPYGDRENYVVALNAAGQVIGTAAQIEKVTGTFTDPGDAWFYSPATNTTQKIGIYDALHTENGYHYNQPVALNASGQVAGTANHYHIVSGMQPYNGQDAWIYSPATNTTQQIGLVDSAHTQTGGYSYHKPVALNDSGQIAGFSSRFSGSTDQGQDAWRYSSTANSTQLIGLTDGAHMQTGGYVFNQPNGMNAAGEIVGFAKRYSGSSEQGQDAWFYSPTTNTTQSIGLIDRAHTQADGTSVNNTTFVNVGGLIVGTAKRYNSSPDPTMSDEGIDSWLFDPVSRVTYNLVSSLSATGFASSTVSYLGNDGSVLGYYAVNGGSRQDEFLWTETSGFHDLGDVVQGGLTAAGWAGLFDAYEGSVLNAYDGDGGPYIIGYGTLSNGSYQTFELTPAAALSGDFNHDGRVDAADYVVWRKGLGTTYTQNDYNVWRAHFGQTAGSGAGASANAAVPEPATLVPLVLAVSGWCLRRSRTA